LRDLICAPDSTKDGCGTLEQHGPCAVTFLSGKTSRMPRYYFHIRDGDTVIRDDEGTELPDFEAAQFEARMCARELIVECLRSGQEINGRKIEIADEGGAILKSANIRAMLDI
jgi:hypothetical protein